jgi:lipid-binding SYLF domain-containing protein
MMTSIPRRSLVLAGLCASVGLAGCQNMGSSATTSGPVAASVSSGPDRSALATEAKAALDTLNKIQPGTQRLANQAVATLVFPSVTKAGLGIGGLYGDGVMFEKGQPTGYFNIAGGTFGFQIGAQTFSEAYFFNNQAALDTFRKTMGFQAGASASAVAASYGGNGEISTETLQKPVVVVTWGQSGLMAGATIEGAKITKLNP